MRETLIEKLLNKKLKSMANKSYEYIYKLPFVKSENQYFINSHVTENKIYWEIFIKCINHHQETEARELWKKYENKLKLSFLFYVKVNMSIVNETIDMNELEKFVEKVSLRKQ